MNNSQMQAIFNHAQDNAEAYARTLYYQQQMLFLISMGNKGGALESFQKIFENSPIADFSPTGSELQDNILQGMLLLSVVLHRCYIMNLPINRLSYIFFYGLECYLKHESIDEFYDTGKWLVGAACDLVNTKNGQSALVRRACQHINENLFTWYNEPQIAEIVGCSVGRLNSLLEAEVGCTVYKYMIRRKLKLACFLLLETEQAVSFIAHLLAFCSSSHFSKVFRQHIGITPTEYRKKGAIFGTNYLLPNW